MTPRYVVIDLGTDLIYPSKVTNSGYVLGDNHRSSFYVWFNGVARELKPEKAGGELKVEDINEAGEVEATKSGPNVQDQLRGMVLPQEAESSVTPQCANSAVALLPAQSEAVSMPAQLAAAMQVIGNGPDGPCLWEMKPAPSGANTFENPLLINYLLPGAPTSSPWNVTIVGSINDGGTIVGTAVYKPTGPNDPIAAGFHGVMLMPMAIVRETTIGSGDYEPIVDNGLDDNAILPVYRTESGVGKASIIKCNTINAVLFQNLSSSLISTMVIALKNKSEDTDEAKLTETAAGSGIFRDEDNHISVTLSPSGQTTSDVISDRLGVLVNDSKLGFSDVAFTLQESSASSHSFNEIPEPVDVILSKPLSESEINTIHLQMFSKGFPEEMMTMIETALNSRVFRDASGATATITHYSNVAGGAMNVAITGNSPSTVPRMATLSETSRKSLQYCNYQRISGDEPVSTPETDGQGIFYIQISGTTTTNITLVSGDHHVTVQATPVKGQPNLLRTGKLVLIESGDTFRAPNITTIQVGAANGGKNPTLELHMFGRKVVDPATSPPEARQFEFER